MNKFARTISVSLPLLLCLPACTTDDDAIGKSTSRAADSVAKGVTSKPSTTTADPSNWEGTIVETMNSGGYSYIQLDTGDRKVWIAGPGATGLTAGQKVSASKGALMTNFRSETLNRTFPEIWFVSAIDGGEKTGVEGAAPNPHTAAKPDAKVEGLKKVEGGYTVEEILTKSAELGGKTVKVRGKVVKFSSGIMGTNWAHIQDGTGSGATADLTITTDSTVAVGDLIVVEGQLTVNKDFGFGYKYAAIIEKAKVTKE